MLIWGALAKRDELAIGTGSFSRRSSSLQRSRKAQLPSIGATIGTYYRKEKYLEKWGAEQICYEFASADLLQCI